jgi:hypothetical protein
VKESKKAADQTIEEQQQVQKTARNMRDIRENRAKAAAETIDLSEDVS